MLHRGSSSAAMPGFVQTRASPHPPHPSTQMHDGPVRMLAKGTLQGIVPWRQARSFFATRLRRRLTEEALVKHIAGGCSCWASNNKQTQLLACVECVAATARLSHGSHRSAPTHPCSCTCPTPSRPAAADESVSRHQALRMLRSWYLSTSDSTACALADSSSEGLASALAPAGPQAGTAAEEQAVWQDDGAFLEWVQGGSGAARIAMELRLLRTRAASRLVAQLAGTAEGTEGLVAGLREAVRSNPSLTLQLRSLVAPK